MNSEVNFALFADGTIGLDALVQLVSDKITDPEPQSADQLSELFRMFDRVSMILNKDEYRPSINSHCLKHAVLEFSFHKLNGYSESTLLLMLFFIKVALHI